MPNKRIQSKRISNDTRNNNTSKITSTTTITATATVRRRKIYEHRVLIIQAKTCTNTSLMDKQFKKD